MQTYNYTSSTHKVSCGIASHFALCDTYEGVTLFSSSHISVTAVCPIITINEQSVVDPLSYVDAFITKHSEIDKRVSFLGYLSYDAKSLFEEDGLYNINKAKAPYNLIEFSLYCYYIFSSKKGIEVLSLDGNSSGISLDDIVSTLSLPPKLECSKPSQYIRSTDSSVRYQNKVTEIVNHIKKGDVYQLNLSREISVITQLSAIELAMNLYNSNTIEYGVFHKNNDRYIISTSPELFFGVKGKTIMTSPIKGTVSTKYPDALERLTGSRKEISELAMIVDLLRNDISGISKPGTVIPGKFPSIIHLRNVLHAYCDVTGDIDGEVSISTIMKSMFPGGSISGCPKIKSCQIIEELEQRPRGIYTGSFGYYNFNSDMKFNIMIRTVTYDKGNVTFAVGGGITVLSHPEDEFKETIYKADNMWKALNLPYVEEERFCIE